MSTTATVVTTEPRVTRTAYVKGGKTYAQTEFGMAVWDRPLGIIELIEYLRAPAQVFTPAN